MFYFIFGKVQGKNSQQFWKCIFHVCFKIEFTKIMRKINNIRTNFWNNYFAEEVWEAVSEGIILRSGLHLKAQPDHI